MGTKKINISGVGFIQINLVSCANRHSIYILILCAHLIESVSPIFNIKSIFRHYFDWCITTKASLQKKKCAYFGTSAKLALTPPPPRYFRT